MLDRRKIRYTYLKLSKKIKDFLLSDKSREFLIFLFFFLIAGGFWLPPDVPPHEKAEVVPSLQAAGQEKSGDNRHRTGR